MNPVRTGRWQSGAADVFCFVLGLATVVPVQLIGQLYLAEILLVVALPAMLILRGKRALRPELKPIYILMAVWLLGLVVSDAYRHTATVDRLRGVALIIFFGLNLLGMSILFSHNEKRKVLYFLGLTTVALLSVRLLPTEASRAYPWKFGYAFGVTQAVMLAACYFYSKRRFLISALFLVGICGVHLVFNFRSPVLGLLLVLALVYPIIPERLSGIQILPRSQSLRLVVLTLLVMLAGGAAKGLVDFVTKAGLVSEEAQAKNEAQSKSGNLLLGGRPEVEIGLQAALDSPIIGHGSWAKDWKYFEMLNDALVESGAMEYDKDFDADADGLIPGHSHIITAWVWAGIAGPIFWGYVAWFVFRGMTRIALVRPPVAPLFMWYLTGIFWDIFFSPFASYRRITEALMLVIVADLLPRAASVSTAWRRQGAAFPRRSSFSVALSYLPHPDRRL